MPTQDKPTSTKSGIWPLGVVALTELEPSRPPETPRVMILNPQPVTDDPAKMLRELVNVVRSIHEYEGDARIHPDVMAKAKQNLAVTLSRADILATNCGYPKVTL